ncbi:MAG: hypothetical protein JWQ71_3865 [Pedosphaera sp.]|nr:hypothetical protein [Pedosphaera sp.]
MAGSGFGIAGGGKMVVKPGANGLIEFLKPKSDGKMIGFRELKSFGASASGLFKGGKVVGAADGILAAADEEYRMLDLTDGFFARPIGPVDIEFCRGEIKGFTGGFAANGHFEFPSESFDGFVGMIVRGDGHNGLDARIAGGPVQCEGGTIGESENADFVIAEMLCNEGIENLGKVDGFIFAEGDLRTRGLAVSAQVKKDDAIAGFGKDVSPWGHGFLAGQVGVKNDNGGGFLDGREGGNIGYGIHIEIPFSSPGATGFCFEF